MGYVQHVRLQDKWSARNAWVTHELRQRRKSTYGIHLFLNVAKGRGQKTAKPLHTCSISARPTLIQIKEAYSQIPVYAEWWNSWSTRYSYSESDSAPTYWRTASVPPLQLYMTTYASERSITSPSRFIRHNSPPYPLHTKKGWGPQPNYKLRRRKIMFLPGNEPNSSVVHPEAYSTLHHYPQSEKFEYAFILNKYAEHSPLWAANGRSPT